MQTSLEERIHSQVQIFLAMVFKILENGIIDGKIKATKRNHP
jgi:hypothetical protein